MAADGKVIIEVLLESDKVEGQLNELKNAFADLGNVGNVFGEMNSLVNTFSSTFNSLEKVTFLLLTTCPNSHPKYVLVM